MASDRPDDTSPEVRRIFSEPLRARTGPERLVMAAEMFSAARRPAEASLPESVRANPRDLRIAIVRRFYGRDLAPGTLQKVIAHLNRLT